jgi:inhibitor of KinA
MSWYNNVLENPVISDLCETRGEARLFMANPKRERNGFKAETTCGILSPGMHISANYHARFERSSDQSLLVYFGQQITLEAHERVRKLLRLMELEPVAGVRNLHPAYCSVLIKFDAMKLRHEELEGELREYLDRLERVNLPEPRQVEIPVCYGGEFGPDLNEVAALHNSTPERVIALHGATTYLVYFLGFVPGFAYLGELPEALVTPRLASPRRRVPAGSVGIAGNQTAVYPFETPGGWRLLGRTPMVMFRAGADDGSVLSTGDHVRFVPISRERFEALESA